MYDPTLWGDIVTWITGLATLALILVGFIQIRNERHARIKREASEVLKQKQSQAELISSWIGDELDSEMWIAVCNNSQLPIYQAIINVVLVMAAGDSLGEQITYPICVSIIPPGIGYVKCEADYHGMNRRAGIEIGFQDTFGNNWIRQADRVLMQINKPPLEHYQIGLPASWTSLLSNDFFFQTRTEYLRVRKRSKR